MVKIVQPLGSLHCNFVSSTLTAITSMRQLPHASERHVFIEQKISVMSGVKLRKSNYVQRSDFAETLDLCRKTMIICRAKPHKSLLQFIRHWARCLYTQLPFLLADEVVLFYTSRT